MTPRALRRALLACLLAATSLMLVIMPVLIMPVLVSAAERGRPPERRATEERRPNEERRPEEASRFAGGGSRSEFERTLDRANRNRLDTLNETHYDAYRRERAGEIVARRPDGKPYDHVTEVRNAQRGMENDLAATSRRMRDLRTPEEEIARLRVRSIEMERVLRESRERTRQTPEEVAALDRVAREQGTVGREEMLRRAAADGNTP